MNDTRAQGLMATAHYLYRGGTGCPVSPLRCAGVLCT